MFSENDADRPSRGSESAACRKGTTMDAIRIDSRLKQIQAEWSNQERVARQNEGQRRVREFYDRFLRAEQPVVSDLQCRGVHFEMHAR